MRKLDLIFDMDDTLSDCGVFYKAQQTMFAEFQSKRTGLPVQLITELREKIDVTFTQTPDGFSRVRFPRSFASTSMTIDVMLGNKVDEVAAYQSYELGDEVFNAMYPLFEGVPEMLSTFYDSGHRLFLMTKGDYEVQTRKININGLRKWFHNDRIYILGQKSSRALQDVIANHTMDKSRTVVIGDSLRDDVGVANDVGVTSVWVSGRHNASWTYENTHHKPHYQIEHVVDLVNLIDTKSSQFVSVMESV